MKRVIFASLLFMLWCEPKVEAQDSLFRISFGSCSDQDKDLSILEQIRSYQPNVFLYLGDNIYGDTRNMMALRAKYLKLQSNPYFQSLRAQTTVIGTWDDHDYGEDDAGRHFPFKQASKRIFLHFFKEPKNSERRKHAGIYTSYRYECAGKTIQIILLDTRTFRDNLLPYSGFLKNDTNYHYDLEYDPYSSADSTMLGKEQWDWLRGVLSEKADIRIIGSSTQFATQFNGYEAWANFPHEQERMFQLIRETNANGIVFLSGDVHYAELCKVQDKIPYPLYDLTCSGLTEKWRFSTPNVYRVGEAVMENHFGIVDIRPEESTITLEVWDRSNTCRLKQVIPFAELLISP
jgi:alkaline phosphatase D